MSRDQITEMGEGVAVILGPMGSHFGIFVTLEPDLVSETILAVGKKGTWIPIIHYEVSWARDTETCQLWLAGEGRTEMRFGKSIS